MAHADRWWAGRDNSVPGGKRLARGAHTGAWRMAAAKAWQCRQGRAAGLACAKEHGQGVHAADWPAHCHRTGRKGRGARSGGGGRGEGRDRLGSQICLASLPGLHKAAQLNARKAKLGARSPPAGRRPRQHRPVAPLSTPHALERGTGPRVVAEAARGRPPDDGSIGQEGRAPLNAKRAQPASWPSRGIGHGFAAARALWLGAEPGTTALGEGWRGQWGDRAAMPKRPNLQCGMARGRGFGVSGVETPHNRVRNRNPQPFGPKGAVGRKPDAPQGDIGEAPATSSSLFRCRCGERAEDPR